MVISRICAVALLLVTTSLTSAQQIGFIPQPSDYAAFAANITDPNSPLPSCKTVGITKALECQALCEEVNGGPVNVSNTRNINGDFICTCTNLTACSDQPTCKELLITPGHVKEECTSYCGSRYTAFNDQVQYPGVISAGNPNTTHFQVECRCDGVVECQDNILFSDVAYPIACTSLSIESSSTCDAYCAKEGGGLFNLGGNFTIKKGTKKGTCDCEGTQASGGKGVAQACTDIAVPQGPQACTLKNPCPTPAPNAQSAGWHPPTSTVAITAAGLTMGLY